MGRFDIKRLAPVLNETYTTVIETGSLFGDGTELLSHEFKSVHTIEIQPELYKKVSLRFSSRPEIQCHCGDSATMLDKLSSMITTPVVFFLDAHWSGDNTVNWNTSSWKGYNVNTGCRNNDPSNPSNQNPLDDELKIIVEKYKQPCIVYIDDMEKFAESGDAIKNCCFTGENWSHLTVDKLISILSPRIKNVINYRDQLVVELYSAT